MSQAFYRLATILYREDEDVARARDRRPHCRFCKYAPESPLLRPDGRIMSSSCICGDAARLMRRAVFNDVKTFPGKDVVSSSILTSIRCRLRNAITLMTLPANQ